MVGYGMGFGSGSGIVHILVSRLILLTLCVILQGASKKSFCGLIQIGPSYQWVNFKCLSKQLVKIGELFEIVLAQQKIITPVALCWACHI